MTRGEWQWRSRPTGAMYRQAIGALEATPEWDAYQRLLTHGSECDTCRSVDALGVNRNLPCGEGARLFEEYRQASRPTSA
ncbi:hypothetical protein [Streptomyces sp. NPDC057877]|uniref:hypothetical protein n=1 Tax=Streptomyces sp. NPDC057877 TaxID=3346269 RepID=UPI00369F11C5